jgi:hypothetical protein
MDVTVDLQEAKAKPHTAIGQQRFLRSAATAFVSENLKFPNRVALFCLRGLASSPEPQAQYLACNSNNARKL